jgi:DNA-binding transcriptional LysR family regulator
MMETQRLRRYLHHGMLPQLAAFDAVMRLGSVTLAAEALHMAQPTVSGHLRKLADAVGVPLFRCDGRRMQPTPAARALHEGALGVFAALHRLECAVAPLRPGLPLQSMRTPPDAATLQRARLDGSRPQAGDGRSMHTSKEPT